MRNELEDWQIEDLKEEYSRPEYHERDYDYDFDEDEDDGWT